MSRPDSLHQGRHVREVHSPVLIEVGGPQARESHFPKLSERNLHARLGVPKTLRAAAAGLTLFSEIHAQKTEIEHIDERIAIDVCRRFGEAA
jgi:hypothetical protein